MDVIEDIFSEVDERKEDSHQLVALLKDYLPGMLRWSKERHIPLKEERQP